MFVKRIRIKRKKNSAESLYGLLGVDSFIHPVNELTVVLHFCSISVSAF